MENLLSKNYFVTNITYPYPSHNIYCKYAGAFERLFIFLYRFSSLFFVPSIGFS